MEDVEAEVTVVDAVVTVEDAVVTVVDAVVTVVDVAVACIDVGSAEPELLAINQDSGKGCSTSYLEGTAVLVRAGAFLLNPNWYILTWDAS